jgi:hypothetical protein
VTRRTAAAAVSLTAALVAGPVTSAGAGQAGRQAQPPTSPAVVVAVRSVAAVLTGKPDDVLRLQVRVTNTTAAAIPRLRWQLRLGEPLTSRSALAAPAPDPSHTLWPPQPDLSCLRACVEELAAGSSHEIDLALPAAELDLPAADRPTVYQLRIEVTSRLYTTVGSADTFLVWFPGTQRSLRVGWVVPVADRPRRDASGLHIADDLPRSIAPGGRLDKILATVERAEQLVGAGEDRLALTLAVDADVVEAVADMADGYLRASAGGAAEPEQLLADGAAVRWLARLRDLATRHAVIALPYADVDAVALVRAGLGTDLTAAIDTGRRRLAAALETRPVETIAWPPDGLLDSTTLSVLASNGNDAVVLDESALPEVAERTYTTTAAADLETTGRTLTALVGDSRLVKLTAAPPAGVTWPLINQRLLAETAVVQQQRPSVPRDLVLPLPRLWAPANVEGVAQAIAATARSPWMATAALPAIVASEQRADNRAAAPVYPDAARGTELATSTLHTISRERADLMAFRALLAPTENSDHVERADAIKAELDTAQTGLTRAESAHWRGRLSTPRRLVRQVRGRREALQGSIRVVFRKVTLTSRSGPVPITIHNGLGTPIEVRVRLHSPRAGLTFGQPSNTFVVQPGQETIDVRFEAVTVGSFPVTVQLYNAEDRPIGASTTANVRTTAFGPVALVVTGVAFALLVLAALLRFRVRRRRRGNGTTDSGAPEPHPHPLAPVGGGPDPT